MTERHLILQDLTLLPSAEWNPCKHGWVVARVNEGVGYWMQPGATARELNVGSGFMVGRNSTGILRASQLSPLKLQFFIVEPQHLNGLLAVTEWHQLEVAPDNLSSRFLIFAETDSVGQRFTRITNQTPSDKLTMRCALLQLWANAIAGFMPPPMPSTSGENKLHERFRKLVSQMTEAELAECSMTDLAAQLFCSERHFSRLFREEFGVSLRARQIELRLQRAQQLLVETDSKITSIAFDSGYRHLGLFNATFKKRFGVTPSEWRQRNAQKKTTRPTRIAAARTISSFAILLLILGNFFGLRTLAQNENGFVMDNPMLQPVLPPANEFDPSAVVRAALLQKMAELDERDRLAKFHNVPATTNGAHFKVNKYLVMGNSLLAPEKIGAVFANVPSAYGTNVSLDDIRAVVGDLRMAYLERGLVTVSVGLPQQKLTNAEVKVKVTEGHLVAVNVAGNHYYSSNNVMRALPDLHTNMILNSRVFQRELDNANASRDRQFYPVIGPGPEPGTSELTLNVKDQVPLHARVELNNISTPQSPPLRGTFSAQYDNLWDLEHQVGVQYTSAFEESKLKDNYSATPLDDPLIANYSAYYRMPIGGYASVQQQVDENPGEFGYDEVTHKFNLPPTTGRADLIFYASRSTSDTGVQVANRTLVNNPPPPLLTIISDDTGENVTLNEDLGMRLSRPAPAINGTFFGGLDFKLFKQISDNTNNFILTITETNSSGNAFVITTNLSTGQPPQSTAIDYLPLNAGLNGTIADPWGTTFYNAQMNFGVPIYSSSSPSQTETVTNIIVTNGVPTPVLVSKKVPFDPHTSYVTLQLGADREIKMSPDWSIKLHAEGQWASGPLNSNEQYPMGGSASVRGYTDGEAYGDEGWRVSIEPQTRLFNIGAIGNEGHTEQCWLRTSVFLDYGHLYLLDAASGKSQQDFCGAGWSLAANFGSHIDARMTVACPLIRDDLSSTGSHFADVHFYFTIGAQF